MSDDKLRTGKHAPIYPSVDPLAVQLAASPHYLLGVFTESTLIQEAGRWHVYVSAEVWNERTELAWQEVALIARGGGEVSDAVELFGVPDEVLPRQGS